MKAKEITESSLPKIELPGNQPIQNWHKGTVAAQLGSEYDNIGSGIEAMVIRNSQKPGVIKIVGSKVSLRHSAYMQYILVARKYAFQNPFLPRVEGIQHQSMGSTPIQITAPPNDPPKFIKDYFVVKLEELVPLGEASSKELLAMYYSVFNNEGDRLISSDASEFEKHSYAMYFCNRLERVARNTSPSGAPRFGRPPTELGKINKNYLAVCRLIRKILLATGGFIDIHSENVMMRRTPYGPQLVISDPVYRGARLDDDDPINLKDLNEAPLPQVNSPEEEEQYKKLYGRYRDLGGMGLDDLDDFVGLGSGIEARVVHDPREPEVIKIVGSRQEIKNNAYMQYILLSRKYANENPYLPRVTSIQKLNGNNNPYFTPHPNDAYGKIKEYYVIKLEKLTKLEEGSAEELEFIFNSMFNSEDITAVGADMNGNKSDIKYHYFWAIENSLTNSIKGKNIPGTDPRLKSVIKLIRKLILEGAENDLHPGNMMIRRTAQGPQLVITDPIHKS